MLTVRRGRLEEDISDTEDISKESIVILPFAVIASKAPNWPVGKSGFDPGLKFLKDSCDFDRFLRAQKITVCPARIVINIKNKVTGSRPRRSPNWATEIGVNKLKRS